MNFDVKTTGGIHVIVPFGTKISEALHPIAQHNYHTLVL